MTQSGHSFLTSVTYLKDLITNCYILYVIQKTEINKAQSCSARADSKTLVKRFIGICIVDFHEVLVSAEQKITKVIHYQRPHQVVILV